MAFARRRAAAGVTQAAIARELGVSQVSVGRWLAESRTTAMVPVRVVTGASPSATGFIVTTPRGLRIESLDIEALCTLVVRCG